LECLGCDLGVEAQPWSRSVAERDRAELVRVFIHPGAGDSELAGELAGIEQTSVPVASIGLAVA
jgi:hypothetical protein